MCFQIEFNALRVLLHKGVPSKEMKEMFPLFIRESITVEYYIRGRISMGRVEEKDGFFKRVTRPFYEKGRRTFKFVEIIDLHHRLVDGITQEEMNDVSLMPVAACETVGSVVQHHMRLGAVEIVDNIYLGPVYF